MKRRLVLPALAAAITLAFYARFFSGYWLGDDFGNLHQQFSFWQRGELWSKAVEFLYSPSQGSFYRPLMMLSLAANFAASGTSYAGWFAANLAVHLANTVLVAMLVLRLAEHCECDARRVAWIAALAFGCSPALAEGVYWVSARSDAWVTFLSLLGFYFWSGRPGEARQPLAFALPLLTVLALGFKESGAVLPMQMAVVYLCWPARRTASQKYALLLSFALAALFFAFRALLFPKALEVYPGRGGVDLGTAVLSLGDWWQALTQGTGIASAAYPLCLLAAAIFLGMAIRGARARLASGLLLAPAGMMLATLLNLGGLSSVGEEGRLVYNPVAWLAIAFGFACARPRAAPGWKARLAGVAAFAVATLFGMQVLRGELREVKTTENEMRALTAAISDWASSQDGFTVLVIDERRGFVAAARNSQASLVLPPIQVRPLMHRVFPTFDSGLKQLYDALAHGFASRLEAIRPSLFDPGVEAALYVRDTPRWPDHVACWAVSRRQIIELERPDPSNREAWIENFRHGLARCAR